MNEMLRRAPGYYTAEACSLQDFADLVLQKVSCCHKLNVRQKQEIKREAVPTMKITGLVLLTFAAVATARRSSDVTKASKDIDMKQMGKSL